jgi:hypothetical protein
MSLRYNEENPDEVLEYSENVGPLHSGISYKIIDDRRKPIEMIRKTEIIS